jgi:hypothetical protein
LVDLDSFVTNLANALSIPANAIQQVQMNLELSAESTTVVTFQLVNYEEVNPILSAADLQNLIATNSPILKKYHLPQMSLMQVSSPSSSTQSSNGSSKAMVIALSFVSGVCVLLAVTLVGAFFYWRRRKNIEMKEETAMQIATVINSPNSSPRPRV